MRTPLYSLLAILAEVLEVAGEEVRRTGTDRHKQYGSVVARQLFGRKQ